MSVPIVGTRLDPLGPSAMCDAMRTAQDPCSLSLFLHYKRKSQCDCGHAQYVHSSVNKSSGIALVRRKRKGKAAMRH